MKLLKQGIKKIADLARLELSEDEIKIYGSQLSDVLDYVDQLKEVDTGDVQPTAQVTGLENISREDEVEEWPVDEVESALGQAPEREDRFVKVKRVLEK